MIIEEVKRLGGMAIAYTAAGLFYGIGAALAIVAICHGYTVWAEWRTREVERRLQRRARRRADRRAKKKIRREAAKRVREFKLAVSNLEDGEDLESRPCAKCGHGIAMHGIDARRSPYPACGDLVRMPTGYKVDPTEWVECDCLKYEPPPAPPQRMASPAAVAAARRMVEDLEKPLKMSWKPISGAAADAFRRSEQHIRDEEKRMEAIGEARAQSIASARQQAIAFETKQCAEDPHWTAKCRDCGHDRWWHAPRFEADSLAEERPCSEWIASAWPDKIIDRCPCSNFRWSLKTDGEDPADALSAAIVEKAVENTQRVRYGITDDEAAALHAELEPDPGDDTNGDPGGDPVAVC